MYVFDDGDGVEAEVEGFQTREKFQLVDFQNIPVGEREFRFGEEGFNIGGLRVGIEEQPEIHHYPN